MMLELRELYQEVILDHCKSPRNFRYPEGATCSADGDNPLCGDKLTVKLVLDGDTIVDIGFQGSGCAISQAAASTMTEAVKGQKKDVIEALFERYHAVVMGQSELNEETEELLGKLAVFAGVAEFPMRVKCATLAWHTMRQAMNGGDNSITTTE